MNDSMDALQSQFRQLRLVETASELPELFRKAEQASWTYRELVQEIVCFELRKREEKSVQKRLKWAKFCKRVIIARVSIRKTSIYT